MGCTVGHSTLPYKEYYPDAEVWGIDAGAPVIRYAHARAQAFGLDVNFAQMNAEKTNFVDGHFDLVVSHILLHETSGKAMPNIFNECNRVLAPGGIMIHAALRPHGPFHTIYSRQRADGYHGIRRSDRGLRRKVG